MLWPWVSRARLEQLDADSEAERRRDSDFHYGERARMQSEHDKGLAEARRRAEAAESQLTATRTRLLVEESEAVEQSRRITWLQEQLAESNARYERLVMRVTEKPPEPTLPASESSLPLEVVEALDECAAGPDRAEATRLARKMLKEDVAPAAVAGRIRQGATVRRARDDEDDGA